MSSAACAAVRGRGLARRRVDTRTRCEDTDEESGRQPRRAPDGAPVHCECHRPEQTTLCRLVQRQAASFAAHTEAGTGSELARFIKDEFEAFLDRSILAQGWMQRVLTRHPLDCVRLNGVEGKCGA